MTPEVAAAFTQLTAMIDHHLAATNVMSQRVTVLSHHVADLERRLAVLEAERP